MPIVWLPAITLGLYWMSLREVTVLCILVGRLWINSTLPDNDYFFTSRTDGESYGNVCMFLYLLIITLATTGQVDHFMLISVHPTKYIQGFNHSRHQYDRGYVVAVRSIWYCCYYIVIGNLSCLMVYRIAHNYFIYILNWKHYNCNRTLRNGQDKIHIMP